MGKGVKDAKLLIFLQFAFLQKSLTSFTTFFQPPCLRKHKEFLYKCSFSVDAIGVDIPTHSNFKKLSNAC